MKPGLVASYDIRPGNGVGLFWFRRFINLPLTYLLRHSLTTQDPQGASAKNVEKKSMMKLTDPPRFTCKMSTKDVCVRVYNCNILPDTGCEQAKSIFQFFRKQIH